MRKLLVLVTFFTLSICGVMAQSDTLYMMKDGVVINKQSIKPSDLDSMIFYKPSIIEEEPTSVTDVEGNIYKVVTIGDQVWMSENLKVTKYNDGTVIPLVTDNSVWKSNLDNNTTNPMMCYYENDISNANTYGALYNWYAVSSSTNGGKNVCPTGWHVPSDGEWTTLKDYIGSDGGAKLKATSGWKNGGNGTDAYGFSGVPGGERNFDGNFYDIGSNGYWWSSTSNDTYDAWGRILNYSSSNVNRYGSIKEDGFSVRCVRD